MYLARFEVAGKEWLQAIVSLVSPLALKAQAVEKWNRLLEGLMRDLARSHQLIASYRVRVRGTSVERLVFVASAPSDELQLRRFLASLTRLNLIADGSAWTSQTMEEHDAMVQDCLGLKCVIALPDYRTGDLWIGCDFNVRSRLAGLVLDAVDRGHDLLYHVNLERPRLGSEEYSAAAKNALRVGLLPGVPRMLKERQELLANKLRRCSHVGEEVVGVATSEAREWLEAALTAGFEQEYGPERLEAPDFLLDDEAYDLALVAARHPAAFQQLSIAELCSSCLTEDEVVDLLTWSPPIGLEQRPLATSEGAVEPEEPMALSSLAGLPRAAGESGDYIFISYKHEDLPRIRGIMRELDGWGYRLWYDKGIPGGAEWDAIIEERLDHCKLLIFFVSEAAIKSKYVRREIKYADAVDKPLIGVLLEKIELSHGLAMLLRQYQMIDAAATDGLDALRRAIEYGTSAS